MKGGKMRELTKEEHLEMKERVRKGLREEEQSDLESREDWKCFKKDLDRRYGATAVILPRPWYIRWNPFIRLYEFFLDMYGFPGK